MQVKSITFVGPDGTRTIDLIEAEHVETSRGVERPDPDCWGHVIEGPPYTRTLSLDGIGVDRKTGEKIRVGLELS